MTSTQNEQARKAFTKARQAATRELIQRHEAEFDELLSKHLPSRINQRKLPVSEYRAYINSEAWATKRAEFFSTHKHKCAACRVGPKRAVIHVHHRTYARLGCEQMSDLVALCARCHGAVHMLHEHGGSLERATDDFLRSTRDARREREQRRRAAAAERKKARRHA